MCQSVISAACFSITCRAISDDIHRILSLSFWDTSLKRSYGGIGLVICQWHKCFHSDVTVTFYCSLESRLSSVAMSCLSGYEEGRYRRCCLPCQDPSTGYCCPNWIHSGIVSTLAVDDNLCTLIIFSCRECRVSCSLDVPNSAEGQNNKCLLLLGVIHSLGCRWRRLPIWYTLPLLWVR